LLTNIKFLKICKHLLMLISILANEKIHLVSICDPTMPKICWTRKWIVKTSFHVSPTIEEDIWCL
jgi:hypothetical protein